MIFKAKDYSQWRNRFAWLPTRLSERGDWIWLASYRERLVESYWLSADGSMPSDGAAGFIVERVASCGMTGKVKILRTDCF